MDKRLDGQWFSNLRGCAGLRYPGVVCDCGHRAVVMRVVGDRPMCKECLDTYRDELTELFNEIMKPIDE